MDTEEKKNTTPPQGKSGKRRKRKPAAKSGEPAAVEKQAVAKEDAPQSETGKPEEEKTAPEVPPAEKENGETQTPSESVPAPDAGSPADTAGEKRETESAAPQETAESSETPQTAEAAEPAEQAALAEAETAAAPEQPEVKPGEGETPERESPGSGEELLPDGLSFTEEDLSDALDKMMKPDAQKPEQPKEELQTDAPEEVKPAEEPVTQTPEKAEEKAETEEQAAVPEQAETEESPETKEDEKRLSDLTRTVQLSVEQIVARMGTEQATEESELAEEEEEPSPTLRDHVRNGVSGMCKWLLLVVFFVLVIAGGGVAWLYRSATLDMVPSISVTFAGQTVEPAAYKWKVPVVGNLFKRTYAETFYSAPVELETSVEQVSPDVQVSPKDYRTALTVTDSTDTVVFEGDVEEFSTFQFVANGEYTAKLVVYVDQSTVSGAADVSGSETWLFSFTVGIRASIHLNSESVAQGGVAAIRVGSTLDGQPPEIETELENVGFFPAGVGWVCYLPIAWNQPVQSYDISVKVSGHTENLTLTVRETDWEDKDYSRESQRTEPYIGDSDMPAEVKKLLEDSDDEIAWTNSNFVQPFLNSLKVKLAYGTTEYVGRSYSERQANTGTGGRTAVNTVLTTTRGELLIAPANGTVVLAKDLGGDYGNTLVIDHGAGVKSIFYGLGELEVKTGDSLKQGQTIASCAKTTVAELRIGAVAVDPLPVWRGQCDALKYY